MTEMTRRGESSAVRTLYVAFELSARTWRLALTTDRQEATRHYVVAAGDRRAVLGKLARARVAWGLPEDARVVSCYEAGRDGFWLHRWLTTQGITNRVLDATSIERDQRAKHVKTDRLDAERLLTLLVDGLEGRKRLRVVRVPSAEAEDARQADRELATVKAAATAIRHRITGLLVTQGLHVRVLGRRPLEVAALRIWDGTPLGPGLRGRIEREVATLTTLTARIVALETTRREAIARAATPATRQMATLTHLKGLGANGAARVVGEFFGWRTFANGRQIGSLAGLTPTPYHSGTSEREQGISKAGNARVRTMMVELAWVWLRFQPASALSRWYEARFGSGSKRVRRIGIVALARKLLIAFWRYLETGVPPEGAIVKA